MTNTVTPRIYVADLAAYNCGYLHGIWIDLDDSHTNASDIHEAVQGMLKEGFRRYKAETLSYHEEFAIHDYEGFGPIQIGEYDSLDTVLAHVERMADNPDAYWAWIKANGAHYADDFDADKVSGPYESVSAWFDQHIEDHYGSLDVVEILVRLGVSPANADALSELITWIDADAFRLMMSCNAGVSLAELPTGEYSVEYWEVRD